MNRAVFVGLALLPILGCATADPLAGKGSTASPALQKAVTRAQTQAAAGLAVSPQPATGSLACDYDTVDGHVTVTIPATATCPLKPPAKAE